ncbi:hypothetical protein A2U01_0118718, partial [Trifolium medium]|nr:hypothetical protein [Trifolium medium]
SPPVSGPPNLVRGQFWHQVVPAPSRGSSLPSRTVVPPPNRTVVLPTVEFVTNGYRA